MADAFFKKIINGNLVTIWIPIDAPNKKGDVLKLKPLKEDLSKQGWIYVGNKLKQGDKNE